MTVDCLRADHCGFYGYAWPTTPFLDSLASESIVVPTAVVAGAPTYYSLPPMFASRMPLALGRDVVGLAPDEDTLATTLRQTGYATAAFTAANPYISRRFGYDQGFDVFRDFLDFDESATAVADSMKSPANASLSGKINRWLKRSAQVAGLSRLYDELYFQYCVRLAAPPVQSIDSLRKYPSADAVIGSSESWLASLGSRPFFLWIHLMDAHFPYYPPAVALQEFSGRQPLPRQVRYLNEYWNRSDLDARRLQRYKHAVTDLYDSGIRWVDTGIARLVSFLRSSNRWDDCVFALTADHGEEFLEHGRRYHAPVSLAEEIVHVPLLIRVPGQRSVERRAPHRTEAASPPPTKLVFSHLHLAPTLLEILDVPPPPSFQGTSLWTRLQPDAVVKAAVINEHGDLAIAECVFGCTNPLHTETLLSPRLLSVRDCRYKLVIRLEPGAVEELYDLRSDAREQTPLTGDGDGTAAIRCRLLRAAAEHMQRTSTAKLANARLRTLMRDLRLRLQE